jgi:hypothetical protein
MQATPSSTLQPDRQARKGGIRDTKTAQHTQRTLTLSLGLGLRKGHRCAGGDSTRRHCWQGLAHRPVGTTGCCCCRHCVLHALLLPSRRRQHGGVLQHGCRHGQGSAVDLATVVAVHALAQVTTAHTQLQAGVAQRVADKDTGVRQRHKEQGQYAQQSSAALA